MGGAGHVGHRVRGRYRSGEQISFLVSQLLRGQNLILECGADENCYAQTRLTLQGVYDIEFRDGQPAEHYRIRTQSADRVAAVLGAWVGAEPGWSDAFDWTCIGSQFAETDVDPAPAEPPLDVPAPLAEPVGGARSTGRVPIFHIASQAHWDAAASSGEYRISTGELLLEQQGFIHASFADQVETVANNFFRTAEGPLVVLAIDEDALPSRVLVERAPGTDAFFPHIYGPLPVGAVTNTLELVRRDDQRWVWPYAEYWRQPVPWRIPVKRVAGNRTDLIGSHADGLFFGGFSRTTYLHLFDRHGAHRWSWAAPAEYELGDNAPVNVLMEHLRGLVDRLPGRKFADIAIQPFAVRDSDDRSWGLFDETIAYGFPHAELRPNRLGFNPPWNGVFDT